MAETRTKVLNDMLKPWFVRTWLAFVGFVGVYDVFSNQFGLPSLKTVLGMSGALMPAWGWAMLFMAGLFYALFEYVRLTVPVVTSPLLSTKNAATQALVEAVSAPLAEPKMNFNPIKNREIWKASTLAEVAAALDPDAKGARGLHTFSYSATVIDAMKHGKLKYAKKPREFHPGTFYAPSNDSEIRREDAIRWIEKDLGFDASELKR